MTLPRASRHLEPEKPPTEPVKIDYRSEKRLSKYQETKSPKYGDEIPYLKQKDQWEFEEKPERNGYFKEKDDYVKSTRRQGEEEEERKRNFEKERSFDKERFFDKEKSFDRGRSFDKDRSLNKQRSFGKDSSYDKERFFEKERSFDEDSSFDKNRFFDKESTFDKERDFAKSRLYEKDKSFEKDRQIDEEQKSLGRYKERTRMEKYAEEGDKFDRYLNFYENECRYQEEEQPRRYDMKQAYTDDDGFEEMIQYRASNRRDVENEGKGMRNGRHYEEEKYYRPVLKTRQKYDPDDERYYTHESRRIEPRIKENMKREEPLKQKYAPDDPIFHDIDKPRHNIEKMKYERQNSEKNRSKYNEEEKRSRYHEEQFQKRSKYPQDQFENISKYQEEQFEKISEYSESNHRKNAESRQRSPSPEELISPKDRFKDAKEKFLLMEKERIEEERRNRIELPISPIVNKEKPLFIKRHESMACPNGKERYDRYCNNRERFLEDKFSYEDKPKPAPRSVNLGDEVKYRKDVPLDR